MNFLEIIRDICILYIMFVSMLSDIAGTSNLLLLHNTSLKTGHTFPLKCVQTFEWYCIY